MRENITDLPLIVKIPGHGDLSVTVAAEDTTEVMICSAAGEDLAMVVLSNLANCHSPTIAVGTWPDGEQWRQAASAPLLVATSTYTVFASRTVTYQAQVVATSYAEAQRIAARADFDLGAPQFCKDWTISIDEDEDEQGS